jgi:predicted DNA-binding transcriptional regulator YafY
MARTPETRIRVLAIERMLNSGRRMKVEEIQQELARKYEIYADNRTIREDIYVLNMFIPIESKRGHDGGFQKVDVLARCKEE